jgi:hypothetical protein
LGLKAAKYDATFLEMISHLERFICREKQTTKGFTMTVGNLAVLAAYCKPDSINGKLH